MAERPWQRLVPDTHLVENVEAALACTLLNNAGLLQQIAEDVSTHGFVLKVKLNVHVLFGDRQGVE